MSLVHHRRKQYDQLYQKLETTWYDEELILYMDMEAYARKAIEPSKKKQKIIVDDVVLITKVSGDKITGKRKEYLKKLGTNYVGFACTLEEENGKVSGILLPYWA